MSIAPQSARVEPQPEFYNYTKKETLYSDRQAVDASFAQPSVAANGTPQSIYRPGPVLTDPPGSTESLRVFQDGTQSPVDLSPPVTPIPIMQHHHSLHTKRSFTTSVVPSSIRLNKDSQLSHEDDTISELSQGFDLKRHSTHQSIAESAVDAPRSLSRHHTTGNTGRKSKKQQEVTISEEFAKELSARRRAFRRLSRRQDDDKEDDRVMVGTRVDKHHKNYVLMYNMLTGIRIGVGRVCAKPNRVLTDEDFAAAHKLVFNVYVYIFAFTWRCMLILSHCRSGDELTPGAKYDFKFKDYAPWAFRQLREQFGIDPADYLVRL